MGCLIGGFEISASTPQRMTPSRPAAMEPQPKAVHRLTINPSLRMGPLSRLRAESSRYRALRGSPRFSVGSKRLEHSPHRAKAKTDEAQTNRVDAFPEHLVRSLSETSYPRLCPNEVTACGVSSALEASICIRRR